MQPLDSAHRRANGGFVIEIDFQKKKKKKKVHLSKVQLRTVRKDTPLLSFVRK